MKEFFYENVKKPMYYKEGCVPAHSDHRYYRNLEELEMENSTFRYSLNGVWNFHYAQNYGECIPGFEKETYCCKTWKMIRVPAHIQLEGYDSPQYVNTQYPWEGHEEVLPGEIPQEFNPVASYVKYFSVPESMKNENIYLALEGVESAAAVWLNGTFIGYHEDSFTTAEFELTSAIKDGENKLAIQVFKWCSGSWCEDQDFFRFSGIYRDVYLYTVPKVHVEDLDISAIPNHDFTSGNLKVQCKMTTAGTVVFQLRDEENLIAEKRLGGKEKILWENEVQHPMLWSSEHPLLYELCLQVYDEEGNIQEYISEKIGFRRFEIIDSIMYLNGKRIVFKGVNRHEFSSITGRAISKEEIEKDLCVMKQNNINAIRTSHYPNRSVLYRLCDQYGFYLIDEMNLETHGTWDMIGENKNREKEVIPKDQELWRNTLLDRAENMYQRDKNHPCILIWSCGNESYGGKVIYDISQYFRGKDKNRLVHYEGIYFDRSYPETSDIESQMYPSVEAIKEFLKTNREKPFICCEYAHAMGNSCGALYKYTNLTKEEPLYQGGFIWDYIDQSLEKKNRYGEPFQAYGGDFQDRPTDYNFSGNGLVYGKDRNPSPKMQEVKFLYQNIELEVKETEVEIKNNHLFSNTNEYECRIRLEREGKLLEQKSMETDVEPLQTKRYKLPVQRKTKAGEYCITVSFHLKCDKSWAKQGHEVAFGQYVYRVIGEETEQVSPLRVIKSNHNIGIKGNQFEALFSLLNGGLVSYKYGDVELLEGIPKPNFWRAPVDNDCGNLMPSRYAQWKIASLYSNAKKIDEKSGRPIVIPYKIEEDKNSVKITFTYCLPTNPRSECELSYCVHGNGKIVTTLTYDFVKELGDMPEFGVLFTLNADYHYLTWYGLGPEETYADRKHGAKLGLYQNCVEDNLASYIVPQECGNKEEVRYAKVTDRKGRGLLFETEEESGAMCFSALPYTPHQMEEAMHSYELPSIHHTIVRVAKAQMGVGGDDSWGARTHQEHLVPVEKKMQFKFSFRGI